MKSRFAVILCMVAGSFSTAQAAVVCGAVIKTAEALTANLACPANNPALTVQGPGSLNMGGNTLTCNSAAIGIKVTGSGATVQNGTISNCGNGLQISSGSGHQVSDILSQSNGGRGFVISGTGNNTFTSNVARQNTSHGYEVIKNNNALTSNRAENNGVMGFEVRGSDNTFNQNVVDLSGKDGFNIFGNNNVLTNNTSLNVRHDGINLKLGASSNRIEGNTVSESGTNPPRAGAFDLKDENSNCGSNIWTNNTGTFNQACIDGSGPPASPGVLQFTAATYNVGEGNGSASVTVSRTDGSTGPVSVAYTTAADGSATEGADYTFTSGVLNWADGDAANKSFNLPIIDDTDVEGSETANLSLSNPDGGATLGTRNTATLSIADNDAVSGGASCAGRTATIVGTSGRDTLYGTRGSDVIAGLDGNDVIRSKEGDDIVCGGGGNDQVYAIAGDDQLIGENGDDLLDGGDGIDSCDGGSQVTTTGDRAVNCETTVDIP